MRSRSRPWRPAFERCAALRARTGGPADENAPCWPAAMAGEAHPVPSRTRKLSPLAPMVLRCSPWESRTPPASKGRFPLHVLRPAPGRPGAGLFCFVGRPASGPPPSRLGPVLGRRGRAEIAHPHRMGLLEPSFVKMRDLGGYAVALSLFSVGGCVKLIASLFVFLSCDERILRKA